MTCISMVYDVNGRKKPNKVGTDIITLNADLKTCLPAGSICIDPSDTPYGPIDCSSSGSGSPDYKYCGAYPSNYASDMWAGANKACGDKGMHLATMEGLGQIAKEIYHLSSPPGYQTDLDNLTYDPSIVTKLNITLGSSYWSSREFGSGGPHAAYSRRFTQSYTGYYNNYFKNSSYRARCVR